MKKLFEVTSGLMSLRNTDGTEISRHRSEREALERATEQPSGDYFLHRPDLRIRIDRGTEESPPELPVQQEYVQANLRYMLGDTEIFATDTTSPFERDQFNPGDMIKSLTPGVFAGPGAVFLGAVDGQEVQYEILSDSNNTIIDTITVNIPDV